MFKKAERKQSKLRLALIGPSGSGKTYSSLLIANGLGGSIALIDTETGSGSLYADLCDYDVAELAPPFTPEKYISAIKEAEKAGYDVVVIDSLSHAWAGQGGILEFVDKATQAQKNNFAAWREASPKHNALVDAMLQASCHLIGTMRSKTAWEVQKDERTGKTKPVKIGLAPVQRDGLEYEFTTVIELSVDGHIASASKDRTSLLDGQYFVPSVKTGEALRAWLNGNNNGSDNGNKVPTQGEKKPNTNDDSSKEEPAMNTFNFQDNNETQNVSELLTQVFATLRELGLSNMLKQYEKYLQIKFGHGVKELSADELKQQLDNLNRCKQDPDLLDKFKGYLQGLDQAKKAA